MNHRVVTLPLSLVIGTLAGALVVLSQNKAEEQIGLRIKQPITVVNSNLDTTDQNDDGWPALSQLIDEDQSEVIGDVQFLLDFGIVGHAKTATSTLMRWLAGHPEVQMYTHEVRLLKAGKVAELVNLLYALPEGYQYKRGYKAPNDIHAPMALDSFRTYFPKTKLIVGIRHPVQWFGSFYNFKIRQGWNMKSAESMAGKNLPEQVFFHVHLSMLGKTETVDDEEELKLLLPFADPSTVAKYPFSPNEVFLYDVSQPFDLDETRSQAFREDLQSFLGLEQPLDPLDVRSSSQNTNYAIDICDSKFTQLRADLMTVSRAAALWIQKYFLPRDDVTVSSPDHFLEILESWNHDPCETSAPDIKGTEGDRPKLSDIVKSETKVMQDVQWLLDFGIVGHSKTATTQLMKWIAAHEEVQMYTHELHQLTFGKIGQFVKEMYQLPAGDFIRGYKAPCDITFPKPREALRSYFPHTKLIIGIRHPIKWFESWYNFKSRQGFKLKNPLSYLGNLPTRVQFHAHLAMMGKTPLSNNERDLLYPYVSHSTTPYVMHNPVFLYDVSQPFDLNETRNQLFNEDLSKFIGLKRPLDRLVTHNSTSRNYHYAIDICEDKFKGLRREILELGIAASEWIKTYFLPLSDVTISSPDHFLELLDTWKVDPCA